MRAAHSWLSVRAGLILPAWLLLGFTAANGIRFAAAPADWHPAITQALDFLVCTFAAWACSRALARSTPTARGRWALVLLYLAQSALQGALACLIALGWHAPPIVAIADALGWSAHLPLAFLVFYPMFDGDQRLRRWLSACDFAQAGLAIALVYFCLVYLPRSDAPDTWLDTGRPELALDLLITIGLLVRARFDPERPAQAVYRRIGAIFAVLTATTQMPELVATMVRPTALLALGLLAWGWQARSARRPISGPALIRARLALSMMAPVTFIVVVLLAVSVPAPHDVTIALATAVSCALFFARVYLTDSSRHATELALRASELRYATMFRASPDGIVVRDLGSRSIIDVNERLEQLLGFKREELLGRGFPDLAIVAPEVADAFFTQLQATGSVRDFPVPVRRKDGSSCLTLSSAELVEIGGRTCSVAILRDVSLQKQAEAEVAAAHEALHRLYARLAQVEDMERRALHGALHDHVAANLSALQLELSVIARCMDLGDPGNVQRHLDGAREIVVETIATARNLMAALRPPALDDYGLAAALRTFAKTQSARLKLRLEFSGIELRPRPDTIVENALFRIAHEAVTNAARHAGATRVSIEIEQRGNRILLTVADDGAGFAVAALPADPDHWGLKHMRERARAIRADLQIRSAPGDGTVVAVDAPMDAP